MQVLAESMTILEAPLGDYSDKNLTLGAHLRLGKSRAFVYQGHGEGAIMRVKRRGGSSILAAWSKESHRQERSGGEHQRWHGCISVTQSPIPFRITLSPFIPARFERGMAIPVGKNETRTGGSRKRSRSASKQQVERGPNEEGKAPFCIRAHPETQVGVPGHGASICSLNWDNECAQQPIFQSKWCRKVG